jgi:hypothetical protein
MKNEGMKNGGMKKLAILIALALSLIGLLIVLYLGCWPKTARPPEAKESIAKEAVSAAAAKAETLAKETEAVEAAAIAARPKVRAKKEALQKTIETRAASSLNLDDLPTPMAMLAEFEAMRELIAALEAQLELEAQRGDAWRDAALAQQALANTLREQQGALLKAERRKGLKWGAAGGAAVVLLLVLL